jgi:hypothetical protein
MYNLFKLKFVHFNNVIYRMPLILNNCPNSEPLIMTQLVRNTRRV